MRPVYQTQKNLEEEEKLAKKYAGNQKIVKLGEFSALDWAVMNNTQPDKIAYFLECKRRYNDHDKYKTYYISVSKMANCIQMQMTTGLSAFIAVQWDDCRGRMPCLTLPRYCTIGGRKDRGDPKDIELLCHFSLFNFDLIYD